jgi:hypothetical protein
VILVLLLFWSRELPKLNKSAILVISAIFVSFLLTSYGNYALKAQYFSYFVITIVSYGTVTALSRKINNLRQIFARTFSIIALFEGILAIAQFLGQRSFVLRRLGEPVLSMTDFGIARIVSSGTFIRAYGTFPHPNILAVFLLAGLFLNIWLILNENSIKWRILYSISLITSLFGLILTFSRASWLAGVIAGIVFTGIYIVRWGITKRVGFILALVFTTALVSFALFSPLIIDRGNIQGESLSKRTLYNSIAIKMIRDKPIFGWGGGESMLHMQQFSPIKLDPWDIQPIHNYYLLSAAEYGIPVSLALLLFFIYHVIRGFKASQTVSDVRRATWNMTLAILLIAFMMLMLLDHYFYTIMQTQLLLWIILGFIAGESMLHAKHINSQNE